MEQGEQDPGNADLQIGFFRTVDLEIGAPRPREPSEIPAEPAGSPIGNPAGAMTEAECDFSRAEQSLRAALTELEFLRATALDLGDRLRLHTLVGYGAHKFNLLRLAVRL